MVSWEYRQSVSFAELQALGREGWELVTVLPAGAPAGGVTYYLKRPALDLRARVTLDQKRRYYGRLGVLPGEVGSAS